MGSQRIRHNRVTFIFTTPCVRGHTEWGLPPWGEEFQPRCLGAQEHRGEHSPSDGGRLASHPPTPLCLFKAMQLPAL